MPETPEQLGYRQDSRTRYDYFGQIKSRLVVSFLARASLLSKIIAFELLYFVSLLNAHAQVVPGP